VPVAVRIGVAVTVGERVRVGLAFRVRAAALATRPYADRLRDTAAGHDPAAPDADPATDPRALNRS